jgi:hypothetical protein
MNDHHINDHEQRGHERYELHRLNYEEDLIQSLFHDPSHAFRDFDGHHYFHHQRDRDDD